jgi:hypothetical protein
LWHGAVSSGYGGFFAWLPDEGIAAAALVSVGENPSGIVRLALDAQLGESGPHQVAAPAPRGSWSRFEGSYDDAVGELGRVRVRLADGELWATFPDAEGRLPITVTFHGRSASGQATHVLSPLGVAKRSL